MLLPCCETQNSLSNFSDYKTKILHCDLKYIYIYEVSLNKSFLYQVVYSVLLSIFHFFKISKKNSWVRGVALFLELMPSMWEIFNITHSTGGDTLYNVFSLSSLQQDGQVFWYFKVLTATTFH